MGLFKTELKEKPLGYWEKKSYMLVVPEKVTSDLRDEIFNRVANIEGVEIKEKSDVKGNEPGKIILDYDKEEYEVNFYIAPFSAEHYIIESSRKNFSQEEKEKLKEARWALTIAMKFNNDSKKSYHLQLKLATSMVPNVIGIMDESAEKMLSGRWAKMTANSNVTPGADDLYSVQAVQDKNGEVWLHTHGLCRCGITELEILQSNNESYNYHYNIITTFASYLIDKKEEFRGSAYIGMLSNKQPIVVTCESWTKGLKEYKNLELGNVKDRKKGHNSKTSIIFIYKNQEDEKNKRLTKVSEFNELWGDNPIFFISNEETARMKALAMERFDIVKEEANKTENKICIKIGLPVGGDNEFEHIWFELIEFEEDRFKAKLLQKPYNVKMREGTEDWYTVDDVTDWVIYTSDFAINHSNEFLLANK